MDIKNYISNIVNESIDEKRDNALRETIKPMVAEALMEENRRFTSGQGQSKVKISTLAKKLMKNPKFKETVIDYLRNNDEFDGWAGGLEGKKYSSLENMSDASKRRTVTQRLKDKKIDYAPIAYKLWPNMSPDAARSWFSKKVDGKNESFTDEEVSKIYNMLNNIMSE